MARIVLVGYGQMLYSLIKGVKPPHKIVGVLRADRLKYRGIELFFKDLLNESEDYSIIKSSKLYDIKAPSVNDSAFLKEIKKLKADIVVVGSWGEKFKKDILNSIPCVNFHPALLPKNRGANPYFWVIYNNQKVTGLTIHYMNEKFDRGDILLQEAITIDTQETGASLKNKTCKLATVMFEEFLDLFDKKQLQPIAQNEEFASYEPQIGAREVVVDLTKTPEEIKRHLRALYPWAIPYVKKDGKFVKLKNYERFINKNL